MNTFAIRHLFIAGLCGLALTACNDPNNAQGVGREIDQAAERAENRLDQAQNQAQTQLENHTDAAKESLSDTAITTKVKAAFLAEPNIASMDIAVSTLNGVVTLNGMVNSLASREQAVEIAQAIPDVNQINNQLKIK